MTRIMIGPLALLAAMAAPPAGLPRAPAFKPTAGATVRGTASVRIVSGARFGADQLQSDVPATRRSARVTDPSGHARSIELLEFQ
jgi:hypothetical protein